jgi:hypothetical protein
LLVAIASAGGDRRLLSRDFSEWLSYGDLEKPIDEARVARAAEGLSLSEAQVRRRYEELAERFGGRLKLTWRENP